MAIFHGHYIDGGFTMPFYKVINISQSLSTDKQCLIMIIFQQICGCYLDNNSLILDVAEQINNTGGHRSC